MPTRRAITPPPCESARLGSALTVRAYGAGDDVIAFDAACADATVVTNGRLELCS
jgi:hypothetical protein